MSEKTNVAIRPEDKQLLANLAKIEDRDMTVVLHRALVAYAATVPESAKQKVKN